MVRSKTQPSSATDPGLDQSVPMVSVITPVWNEEPFIGALLDCVCAQDYPADRLEVIVIDGGSTDRSAAIVRERMAHDARIRLLINPRRTQATSLNLGIAAAQGEYIVRLDCHAAYGPTYVGTCVSLLASGAADNVGGRQRAVGGGYVGKAIAAAMQSRFGAGNAAYRVCDKPSLVDTVWLGSWRRDRLLELGGFDEAATTNEDYELNIRLRQVGGRVLLVPDLDATYYPRPDLVRLWCQYYRYGRGKYRILRLHPGSWKFRQVIPPAFVAAVVAAAAFLHWNAVPLLACLSLYALAACIASVVAARRMPVIMPLLPVVYACTHLAWGLGFWSAVMSGRYAAPSIPGTTGLLGRRLEESEAAEPTCH